MKRIFKSLAVVALSLSLVACSSGKADKDAISLKVWGSQESQAFLTSRIEDFKAANKDKTFNIELGVVGEPDARDKVTQDLDAAADVFAFSNDQLADLHKAGALYEITKDKESIVKENVEGSVEAATIDGKLLAYPMTADNGYFMYYDKSVFSEEDVKSLDQMMKVATEKNKKIFFDLSNGWYNAAFFLGAGGTIENNNGKQTVDFNNEMGVKVGEYMRDFAASPAFMTGDDAILQSGMGNDIAAGVSGTWTAEPISTALGENYAATKLPTITLDGKEHQLASFGGYKLLGVKTSTKHPEEAMALAHFLTNEESQIKRFEAQKIGPSNIKAMESDVVKADIALNALALQSEFAVNQNNVQGSYWTPTEAFGLELENKTTEDVKALLDKMVQQIEDGVAE